MSLLKILFGFTSEKDKIERRETEGYTAWHPEYGRVYYPPTREKYDVSVNNSNWSEHGSNNAWDYT